MCRPAKLDIQTNYRLFCKNSFVHLKTWLCTLYANDKHLFFEPVESGHVSLKHNTSFKNKLQVQVKLTVLPQRL